MNESRLKENILESILTKDLINELESREGVSLEIVAPHKEKEFSVSGAAIVLVVID